MEHSTVSLWLFLTLGILAILVGGMLMAFTAKTPSRLVSWASAYLVLIVGLAQAIIGIILYSLDNDPATFAIIVAFFAFNLGNAAVIMGTIGRYRKKNYRQLVDAGGVLLVLSMVTLLVAVHHAVFSWQLVFFYVIIVTILVTMPIGLLLSRRRKIKG